MPSRPPLLFSVDLEDVRDQVPGGARYAPRVAENTRRYLRFLDEIGGRATFFVVGRSARREPGLLREIAAAGHELACHGDAHLQLDKLTAAAFRADLERNREALLAAGAEAPVGFRAPTFSLTRRTAWAHEVLAEMGFRYSSSVLPAANPLYGWPGFGQAPRRVAGGLWELPITLHARPRVPLAGGVYFRVLPWWLIRRSARRCRRAGRPLLTYLHPYDIDTGQERFMHPDIHDNRFYNFLMYYNRAGVFDRLGRLAREFAFCRYRDYLDRLEAAGG